MTGSDNLLRRGLQKQALSCTATALAISWTVPYLLLLAGDLRAQATWGLLQAVLAGGALSGVLIWFRLRRFRFLLRSLPVDQMLASESHAVDLQELERFVEEPRVITLLWLGPPTLCLLSFATPLRPELMDSTTGVSVALLAVLVLATASLPLGVMVRRDFLRVIEQLPSDPMFELIRQRSGRPNARRRLHRRLLLAVTAPVVFATLGSALIVNAHIRRADEESRKQTARAFARAVLEPRPGSLEGLNHAVRIGQEQGFAAQVELERDRFGVILDRGGIVQLTSPLDEGGATVRFSSSTVGVLGLAPVLVATLAVIAASLLGYLLGNLLNTDLYFATRGVRLLGTNPNLAATGAALVRPARLKLVADLLTAVERVADRFAMFSQAQEKAIEARAAATRMRGLFFASVSHDLKSPLNSILGFAHLVGLEPLTQGQTESLDAIHSRAQELLALIETILDAARVEEGQLSLVSDEVLFSDLYAGALSKAGELCGDYPMRVYDEIEPAIPPLLVDRARVVRALATLIAYSVRAGKGAKMWLRAEREREDLLRIDVDVPTPQHSPQALESMLSPNPTGGREHRGLALGLRLARSVVELHHGRVRVVDRGKKGAMFCITLPTRHLPLPTASTTALSVPPPPSSKPT